MRGDIALVREIVSAIESMILSSSISQGGVTWLHPGVAVRGSKGWHLISEH